MKKATNRQLKDWGAVIPGYPVRRGIALIPDPAAETVKAAAGAAGFDAVPLRGVGYDYNYGGWLYLFRSYYHRSRRYCYHIGGGAYWSRREFARHFDGSRALFAYCWRRFLKSGAAGVDDVSAFLDDVAADAVNRPGSPFYIHG